MSTSYFFDKISSLVVLEPCFVFNFDFLKTPEETRESYKNAIDPFFTNKVSVIGDIEWGAHYKQVCESETKNSTACAYADNRDSPLSVK